MGFHDLKLHGSALQTLAVEVIRVDVHAPVSALHDAGDEHLGMQSVVLTREDLPDGSPVAIGKPGHAFRVDVQFPKPLDTRNGAPQRIEDFVRVILVTGILGRLMGGAPSRARHREDHIGRG
jgi:hypothetical protein